MFTHHNGDAILEYIVLGALVLVLIGAAAYALASKAGAEGTAAGNWISSIAVPNSHP